MGSIITFYSYKGGVGRTMALANIGTMLAMWGKRVLLVDWDLEAPGIEHFFFNGAQLSAIQKKRGLIELLSAISDYPKDKVEDAIWRPLVTELPAGSGTIHLLTAGARIEGYFQSVRHLDVKDFYENQNGGNLIESLRNSWKSNFDFVLVDSRTGITDIGGICTIQLPDILALVFTATKQSLSGVIEVATKAASERQKLPFDRSLVPSLPIPSRFDTQTEHQIAKDWLNTFETDLSPLYKQWLPQGVNRREFLELTKVPYTPYFSFGEKLPVVEQGTNDPTGLGFAYETLAALVANNMENVEQLVGSRDEFIRRARSPRQLSAKTSRKASYTAALFIELSKAGTLRSFYAAAKGKDNVFDRYRQLIATKAEEHAADTAAAATDDFLLVFTTMDSAVLCALAIQKQLMVRKPIVTELGTLQVRMAIPYSGEESTNVPSLLRSAAAIVSEAKDGEVLISAGARARLSKDFEDAKFRLRSDKNELQMEPDEEQHQTYEVLGINPIQLNPTELVALGKQDPASKGGGGFQAFLVGLQTRVDRKTGKIELSISDEERIARYAHDYKSGGWQARLRKIFGRTLGHNLGRELD